MSDITEKYLTEDSSDRFNPPIKVIYEDDIEEFTNELKESILTTILTEIEEHRSEVAAEYILQESGSYTENIYLAKLKEIDEVKALVNRHLTE